MNMNMNMNTNTDSTDADVHLQRDLNLAAKVLVKYGLAKHHFDVSTKGKSLFQEALQFANLDVEATGAEGRELSVNKMVQRECL